jgi:polar amino acid transport system substrate-binding protein
MILKKIINFLIVLLIFVCSSSEAQQNDKLPHIYIVTEHLPPFQISTKTEVQGFATEIIETAFSKTPYSYDIKIFPWSRSYHMALNKENTCIYSIARTPEREDKLIWVNTIAERNTSFVSLVSQNLTLTSLEDAKRYNTAVIRDDVTHQFLLENGFKEGLNLYVINNTHSLLKLLTQRKNINFILVDPNTIKYRAEYNNLAPNLFKNGYQINEHPLTYYLACNKKTSPEVIEKIRQSITDMKVNGQIDKIINEWGYNAITVS